MKWGPFSCHSEIGFMVDPVRNSSGALAAQALAKRGIISGKWGPERNGKLLGFLTLCVIMI
jgi:hypothetical protein